MTSLTDEDVKAIVSQTVTARRAEQKRLHEDSIDDVVLRTLTTILTSFGMEEDDRKELRADLAHLRKWRKSVKHALPFPANGCLFTQLGEAHTRLPSAVGRPPGRARWSLEPKICLRIL